FRPPGSNEQILARSNKSRTGAKRLRSGSPVSTVFVRTLAVLAAALPNDGVSIMWAVYVVSLINFGVKAAKQIVANTELINLNLCLLYHALPQEAKELSEAIMATRAPKFVERAKQR